MWQRLAFSIGALTIVIPATAAAQDTDSGGKAPASRIRLMGNMGVASAIGEMGGTITYAPRPEIQMELGAGMGYSGLQLSLMPKWTAGGRNHRMSIGIGPSMGIGSNRNPSEACISYWLNAEVGYEYRSASGFSFLAALGIGSGLAGQVPHGDAGGASDPTLAIRPDAATDFRLFPQGRIAFGRWF